MKNAPTSLINILLALEWLILIGVLVGGEWLTMLARTTGGLTDHTHRFAKAGHAHGGVLTTLGMVYILCLARTDFSPRTAFIAWALWLLGSLSVSGGLFLHGFQGEPGQGSLGTTLMAVGGIALMIAAVALSWGLFRSR